MYFHKNTVTYIVILNTKVPRNLPKHKLARGLCGCIYRWFFSICSLLICDRTRSDWLRAPVIFRLRAQFLRLQSRSNVPSLMTRVSLICDLSEAQLTARVKYTSSNQALRNYVSWYKEARGLKNSLWFKQWKIFQTRTQRAPTCHHSLQGYNGVKCLQE